jgi:hypothetical protein
MFPMQFDGAPPPKVRSFEAKALHCPVCGHTWNRHEIVVTWNITRTGDDVPPVPLWMQFDPGPVTIRACSICQGICGRELTG